MQFTSNIPFKNNIYKNFDTNDRNFLKKKKKLVFYKDYLIDEWSPFFKDKSLYLKNVESIFRIINALENYNRIFKYIDNMRANISFFAYIDNNIKDEFIRYQNIIEAFQNKAPKYELNTKTNKKLKEENLNIENLNYKYSDILENNLKEFDNFI